MPINASHFAPAFKYNSRNDLGPTHTDPHSNKRKRAAEEDRDEQDKRSSDGEFSPSDAYTQRVQHAWSEKSLQTRFGQLNPPIKTPFAASSVRIRGQSGTTLGLRQKHIRVLTAILHQSLLKADYSRAARAWQLLLRTEVSGHSFDPRHGQRWGIGCEILSYQSSKIVDGDFEIYSHGVPQHDKVSGPSPIEEIDRQRVEKVKGYFTSLQVQYPYHKLSPHSTNSLDFCYALLTFWIHEVWRKQLSLNSSDLQKQGDGATGGKEEKVSAILHEAQEISSLLEGKLSSPPFSDSEAYIDLQKMVRLWITGLDQPLTSRSLS